MTVEIDGGSLRRKPVGRQCELTRRPAFRPSGRFRSRLPEEESWGECGGKLLSLSLWEGRLRKGAGREECHPSAFVSFVPSWCIS